MRRALLSSGDFSDVRRARLAHFPEGFLSGYAGENVSTWADVDWGVVRSHTELTRAGSIPRASTCASARISEFEHDPQGGVTVSQFVEAKVGDAFTKTGGVYRTGAATDDR